MEWIRELLKFDNCLAVDCVGKSKGLALLRMKEVNMDILSYSQHQIEAMIKYYDLVNWRLTGFYDFPNHAQRNRCHRICFVF